MKLTETEISEIVQKNCGTPPDRKRVEHHIWVNKEKLKFYSKPKSGLIDNLEHKADMLDSYERLIKAGEKLLKEIEVC